MTIGFIFTMKNITNAKAIILNSLIIGMSVADPLCSPVRNESQGYLLEIVAKNIPLNNSG